MEEATKEESHKAKEIAQIVKGKINKNEETYWLWWLQAAEKDDETRMAKVFDFVTYEVNSDSDDRSFHEVSQTETRIQYVEAWVKEHKAELVWRGPFLKESCSYKRKGKSKT